MEKKIYLVENWDCEYRAFDNFEDAVHYGITQVLNSPDSEQEKIDMLSELITSMAECDRKGFAIDQFMWCWDIDYFERAVTE